MISKHYPITEGSLSTHHSTVCCRLGRDRNTTSLIPRPLFFRFCLVTAKKRATKERPLSGWPLWLLTPINNSQNLGVSRTKRPDPFFAVTKQKRKNSGLGTRLEHYWV